MNSVNKLLLLVAICGICVGVGVGAMIVHSVKESTRIAQPTTIETATTTQEKSRAILLESSRQAKEQHYVLTISPENNSDLSCTTSGIAVLRWNTREEFYNGLFREATKGCRRKYPATLNDLYVVRAFEMSDNVR